MEADDLGTYVVKYTGAGQGRKALVAEVISAALARACGLAVPELVAVDLDPALADGEPDEEIQDLLRSSPGLNLGVDFLSGAVDFDAAASTVDGALAGRIVWFDALTGNADRSWRNPNMLFWRESLYLIDHGATLTYQHRWEGAEAAATRPYDISDHALSGCGPLIAEADADLAGLVTDEVLEAAVADVPDDWLPAEPGLERPELVRRAHVRQLKRRLAERESWLAAMREALLQPGLPVRKPTGAGRPHWLTRSPRRSADGGDGS
jgi:hypothetical protein